MLMAPSENYVATTPEGPKFTFEFEFGKLTKSDIIKAINYSFRDYLRFEPHTNGKLIKKGDIIDNIFFKLGISQEAET